ncbi:Stp1/IreP family PP2C-type Ser/Thr phosphatase [Actinomadura sp. WAC 06369]|uniref:Stp1/IreP family PP2C-type Ser/Thr phosphatase n=1 Tax=Actinomadura sp. WAC 06369 TaxID=2203193 RepID=UPI000F77FB9C|nr:Stp1/IreP family PP2C-type Ser/Thr phosphatase [Actinomadura sp. WAC 06369]RSN70362.1 Stp1/IreP family PP2C-type Ser/Thr phosphatase [Actinomadura sp. WAC 06369]
MTLGIRYAARSDVGMLREGNEDSAYAGAHLLAVADGMGGHVGGEIASAAAIEALRRLDKDLPANELLAALEHTVKAANDNLHRIVESDPALQGMGTTLTAMLWAGDQVALVHIGDSRAYLLRDGSLFQITHDHTLVQSLVDEGRISPDEAASHPQRSLLLRALDGRGEVDPDLSLREAQVGDRYLLCSDGLSGVVTAETIFQVLTDVDEPEQAVRQLIDLANRGGGPDNITCVVADVVDLDRQPPTGGPGQAVGAAATASPPEPPGGPGTTMPAGPADTPAGRAAQLRDTRPQPPVAVDEMPPPMAAAEPAGEPLPDHRPDQMPPPGGMPQPAPAKERKGGGVRKWAWLLVVAGVVVLGIGAGGFVLLQNVKSGYYIGAENGRVVLFRGTPQDVPGLDLSRKAAAKEQPNPPILLEDLPQAQRQQVEETYTVEGPAALEKLQQSVCKYVVTAEKGNVVIVKGAGQQNCEQTKITGSEIRVSELPMEDAAAVTENKLVFAGRQEAQAKLQELGDNRDACKAGDSNIEGCPSDGGTPR